MLCLYCFLVFLPFSVLAFCDLGLAVAADAIDIKCKAVLAETLQLHVINSHNDCRGFHLCHLAAHRAYLVAVTVVVVAGLVLSGTLKPVAYYKPQFKEKIQRVVKCGSADGEIKFVGKFVIQFLQGEMAFDAIDGPKYCIALWCLAMIVHLKKVIEDALYISQNTVFHSFFLENRTKVQIFEDTKES